MTNKSNNDQQQQVDINKLIHEPARLKILAQLYVVESADFLFIMRQTGLTQGNVSGHLNKLEDAKYVKNENYKIYINCTAFYITSKAILAISYPRLY